MSLRIKVVLAILCIVALACTDVYRELRRSSSPHTSDHPISPTPAGGDRTAASSLQRLRDFPSQSGRLRRKVTIFWSKELIPFIEAEDRSDVPFAMGLVHAHLRWAQLEILRLLASGNISLIGGPFTTSIDHLVRTLNLGKAIPEIIRTMPHETHSWLSQFVAGINEYIIHAPEVPPEFRPLGLNRREWRIEDIVLLSRLLGADVNWIRFSQVIGLRHERGFAQWWQKNLTQQLGAIPSFTSSSPLSFLPHFSRSGSNSLALSGRRTASGGAIIANDPHVGLVLPALWVAIGASGPGYKALGLTIPGIPFVLLGRNEYIAWGGTNMAGLSSALVSIPKEANDTITSRTEIIPRRWWLPARRAIRESPYGPIISDVLPQTTTKTAQDRSEAARASDSGDPLALWWRGHQPSDELTALLKMNVSTNFQEFRAAFHSYAVSGQNFLYGDKAGNVGQIMAFAFDPGLSTAATHLINSPSTFKLGGEVPSDRLPWIYDPPEGVLASANNLPNPMTPPPTLSGNWNDRMERLLVSALGKDKWRATELSKVQLDVASPSAQRVAIAIVNRLQDLHSSDAAALMVMSTLQGWDGEYRVDSTAPPLLHELVVHLAQGLYRASFSGPLISQFLNQATIFDMIAPEIAAGKADPLLLDACHAALSQVPPGTRWGDIHLLTLSHPASRIPLLGQSFRYGALEVPGFLTTVLKTAGPLTGSRHSVTYGAAARQVIDLGDDDENYLVILGGQDGWWGSSHATDQIPLWAAGQLVRLSFNLQHFAQQAATSTTLAPHATLRNTPGERRSEE